MQLGFELWRHHLVCLPRTLGKDVIKAQILTERKKYAANSFKIRGAVGDFEGERDELVEARHKGPIVGLGDDFLPENIDPRAEELQFQA